MAGTSARTALITGGTRGIGRAIALRLARDGAQVVLVSRHRDSDANETLAMLQDVGMDAIHVAADVATEDGVQAAFEAAAARFGNIDIVVHSAGLRSQTALADMTLAHWRDVMAVNLDAAFLCSRAALSFFPPQGGRIVFIQGTAASIGIPNRSHVSAAKAALGGLARSLAAELADRQITVNCVSPGLIDTGGTAAGGSLTPAMQKLRIVANRLGRPEEIAAMVALVVSEDGAYITGQVLHVNGGMYFGQ